MKIVIIGGTGLIGSKLVARFNSLGHLVLPASPSTGVNAVTGEGLARVLEGADVVVDVSNSPSFKGIPTYEDKAAMKFFHTAGSNILEAEKKANVKHHIVLSVVGTERLLANSYFCAKMAQENLVRQSGIPFSVVHSTQFFEYLSNIVQSGFNGEAVYLPPASIQPIAADDVADQIATVALGNPLQGKIEIAGPNVFQLSTLAQSYLNETKDARLVVPDVHALYYGTELNDRTLLPAENARLGSVNFEQWLRNSAAAVS